MLRQPPRVDRTESPGIVLPALSNHIRRPLHVHGAYWVASLPEGRRGGGEGGGHMTANTPVSDQWL